MKAVITVIGEDKVGILAKVSSVCAKYNISITDVTQSIMQNMFSMIMLVNMDLSEISCAELSDKMSSLGKEMGLSIHSMHEDLFNSMHRI